MATAWPAFARGMVSALATWKSSTPATCSTRSVIHAHANDGMGFGAMLLRRGRMHGQHRGSGKVDRKVIVFQGRNGASWSLNLNPSRNSGACGNFYLTQ